MSGEYVFAIHDFSAENEDEIAFRAGERIEVVEKDDEFGDGWWQGRNLAGKVGLFPLNYTTFEPPHPTSPPAVAPLSSSQMDERQSSQMAATMTDVQKAIDQLGMANRATSNDTDVRSFSFASGTDTGDDESDGEGDGHAENGATWAIGSRQLLAEKARRELEDRQRREMQSAAAPPIDVAMSDESESEPENDDEPAFGSARTSVQPVTPTFPSSLFPTSTGMPAPPAGDEKGKLAVSQPSAASSKTSLLLQQANRANSYLTIANPDAASEGEPSPTQPTTTSAPAAKEATPATSILSPLPKKANPDEGTPRAAAAVPLPTSPPPANLSAPATSILSQSFLHSGPSSPLPTSTSAPSAAPASLPPSASAPKATDGLFAAPTSARSAISDPNTWDTAEVVSWLASKGFDSQIQDKFAEQDISGDVLLSLDTTLLKDELGITAFGKRVRLNNAILDLKRSTGSPGQGQDVPPSAPSTVSTPGIPEGLVFSPESAPRTGEMSPFEWTEKQDTIKAPKLDNAPIPLVGLGFADSALQGHRTKGSISSLESGINGTKKSSTEPLEPSSIPEELETSTHDGTADDDATSLTTLSKPWQHTQSSRSSRDATGTITSLSEDRAPSSASASVKHTHSSETPASSIPASPSGKRSSANSAESPTSNTKRSSGSKSKKGADGQKDSRLSFFGGTIGKARKPPPRYSSEASTETSPTLPTQSSEKRSLSRLYLGGSTHKKSPSAASNIRTSSTTATTPKTVSSINDSPTLPSNESPNVLRKRLSSSPGPNLHSPQRNGSDQPIPTTAENALELIGTPDHEGWMRKKGERYNSWKLRYFVLKGHHLYYMRSKTEAKIKGYINVSGYKVIADANTNVGKYGFRIVHETEKPHSFSSEEQLVIREWMKAIMKATIGRDYSRPVISSCNIPTIPLTVAQAMSPAPRPPSPSARDATQRALRPANPDKLSDRDAAVLMLSVKGQERPGDEAMRRRVGSVMTYADVENDSPGVTETGLASPLPARPERGVRQPRKGPVRDELTPHERQLLDWLNQNLPKSTPPAADLSQSCASGLILFRLIERLSGKITGIPDSLFMVSLDDENSFEGLFKLFDIMVENGISTEDVSMSDVHGGVTKSIVQLVESIQAWSTSR